MKPGTQKRFAFIGKSLAWSLLLYVVMMLALNWEEVSNTVSGKTGITVVNTSSPDGQVPVTPTNISSHGNVAKSIVAILKTISGITTKAAR